MLKRQHFLSAFLLTSVLCLVASSDLYGNVINVPEDVRTIQGAINQSRDLDTVLVHPGTYNENIIFGGREILLTSLIMLDNEREYIDSTIIDGSGESACLVFRDGEGEDCIVRGFTITNGWQNFGGGIDCQNDTAPILEDLLVTGNEAAQIGAGIYCTWSSTPTIRNCIIENNIAMDGAGIGLAHECHPIITNVIIRENEAERYGGGVFAGHGDGEGTFEDVTIIDNTAERGGGAYFEWTQNLIFNNVTFEGNSATDGGGGIYSNEGDFSLNLCEITGSEGGAIAGNDCIIEIDSCEITDNAGVAIYVDECVVNLTNTQLTSNYAGIIASYTVLTMNLSEITECDSLAISVFDSSVVVIDSSEILNNAGAGMVIDSSIVTINVTNINGNLFGIFASDSDLSLLRCEVTDSDSFGISVEDSSVVQIDSTEILRNGGGGIFIDSCIVSLNVTNINENMLGLFASDSDLGLMRCEISENDSFGISLMDSSVVQIDSSNISDNVGIGLVAESSSIDLASSEISGNETGIECFDTDFRLFDCEVKESTNHGIWVRDSSLVEIDNCKINSNAVQGLRGENSTLIVHQSELNENRGGIVIVTSSLNIGQCDISENLYFGIYAADSSNIYIENCTVNENALSNIEPTSGLFLVDSELQARACVIRGNGGNGGMVFLESSAKINSCYIIENEGDICGALYSRSSEIICTNSTFINNISNDIVDSGALTGTLNTKISLINNLLWGNQPISIYTRSRVNQEFSDTVIIAYTNLQGGIDSVGGNGEIIWLDGNIDADPLFAVIDSLGHSFLPNSPCIDAGTAFFVYEGDTLVNYADDEYLDGAPDMGAFERDHTGIDDGSDEIPEIYTLISTYPNPFNSSLTTIINLKAPSFTRLAIFNLQGREVAVLNNKPLPAGKSNFIWDAAGYSQGIYFIHLETPSFEVHRKVVFLK